MIFGIMGAMPDEVDQLCARLENVTVEPYGGVEYAVISQRHGSKDRP